MKFWLLDADVIIDLLEMGVFDALVRNAEVSTSETVAGEVRSFRRESDRIAIDFKSSYVETGKVSMHSAPLAEIQDIRNMLPGLRREGIDLGSSSPLQSYAKILP